MLRVRRGEVLGRAGVLLDRSSERTKTQLQEKTSLRRKAHHTFRPYFPSPVVTRAGARVP